MGDSLPGASHDRQPADPHRRVPRPPRRRDRSRDGGHAGGPLRTTVRPRSDNRASAGLRRHSGRTSARWPSWSSIRRSSRRGRPAATGSDKGIDACSTDTVPRHARENANLRALAATISSAGTCRERPGAKPRRLRRVGRSLVRPLPWILRRRRRAVDARDPVRQPPEPLVD
jgi:hypothetical protein